jgi:hypothetical protein
MTDPKKVTITGSMTRLFCHNDNFHAGRMTVEKSEPAHSQIRKGMSLSIAGKFAAREGERITVFGNTKVDPAYGFQIDVKGVSLDFDMSRDGLIAYLEKNKNFPGIGPSKARSIVEGLGRTWRQRGRCTLQ